MSLNPKEKECASQSLVMVKSYIVLKMYDELRKGKKIDLRAWCDTYNISLPTFRRHIAFLRGYLMETHGIDLIYDRAVAGYRVEPPFPF